MKQNRKLSRFYESDLGKQLYKKVSEIISPLIATQSAKILLIGYVDAYLSLFKDHNVYTLNDLKNTIVRFEKIFIFHYLEQHRGSLQYLFSRLEKSLIEGGEVIILASKAYSIEDNKTIFSYKNIFLENTIISVMKRCGFVKIRKFLILAKYYGWLILPFFARFIVIHASVDDKCKIFIGRFEPIS